MRDAVINYYEQHIGDYMRDTAHLSMLEDGAYRRLMDVYYAREAPLPDDRRAIYKLARASTKAEREAVDYVLTEYFKLIDGSWHQKRCDEEIDRYREKEPERQMKKEGNRARQKRNRERRRELFDALRSHGIVPSYDASITELQATLSRVTSRANNANVTHPVTRDGTATQTPDTIHQKEEDTHVAARTSTNPRARADDDPPPPDPNSPGGMAGALRRLLVDITSQNPILLKWIEDGYTTAQIVEAVEIARERKPGERIPAKYLDAIVRSQASQTPSAGGEHGNKARQRVDNSAVARVERANADRLKPTDEGGNPEPRTIAGERVG